MPRFFTQKLTEFSDYLADWSRTGELLFSATHRYSYAEMLPRGFIITATALSGFLAAQLNDEENSHFSDLTIGSAVALAMFVVSHTIVISPLVYKRYLVKQDCKQLTTEIETQLKLTDDNSTEFKAAKQLIMTIVEATLRISLSDDQHARASQTWGFRRSLLTKIKEKIGNDANEIISFWKGSKQELTEKLADLHLGRKPASLTR